MRTAYEEYQVIIREDGLDLADMFYNACAQLMDDDLREQMHGKDWLTCGKNADLKTQRKYSRRFLKEYCRLHEKKFNEEFIIG